MTEFNRVTIVPKDEDAWLSLRTEDLTSTDVSALFGISPYMTHFELWHQKKSKEVVKLEGNNRMTWGTRLQDSIGAGIAEDNNWAIRKMTEYMRIPELKIGASFDFLIESPMLAILETKNVDSLAFKDGWIIEGENVEAPLHIELQVQHQMLVSGKNLSYIGALIGGNRVVLIKREKDEKVHASIIQRSKQFWKSIVDNRPPAPDFARDAEFIKSLYSFANPGTILDVTGNEKITNLVTAYKLHSQEEKEAKELKQATKAELLTLIGTAEKVISDRFSISAAMVGPKHVEYDADGYRDFRIFLKKVKVVA